LKLVPELGGIVASLFPPLFQVGLKRRNASGTPSRLCPLGELTGPQKSPHSFALQTQLPADIVL
jgi:hypothetical protein